MAVSGIAGTGITGTLSNGRSAAQRARSEADTGAFLSLIQKASADAASVRKGALEGASTSGVASGQISSNHRLTGDYTQGFYGYYTSEADKSAAPEGLAAAATRRDGGKVTIDRTSDLYAQSKELENYMVKMMLSSMRETIHHTGLTGEGDYARDMYEDMMYDNYAEQLTKASHLGLADQIYIELSGQR